jgi:hypothetical protein
MPDESFYTVHDDFEPDAPGGIRWRVHPPLVRSIECWCSQIQPIEPIESELITNRAKVQQHFHRWCLEVQVVHQLDRSSLVESFGQHLFDRLRLYPEDRTIRLHWMAFFMHRCVAVGWKIWRLIPQQVRSFPLFQEIILSSHCQIANFSEVQPMLANFTPAKSQFVSGLSHITTYIDRQIKYSIFPDLRKILGEPNFGRSNLGVAARHSLSKIQQALNHAQLADIDEYIILWQCFSIYKRETGINVNRLVESDFETIDRNYQIRSTSARNFLRGTDVKIRLEQIGKAVRDLMLCQPLALDAPINEFQSLGDITPDDRPDLLECQMFQEKWKIINAEAKIWCESVNSLNYAPSHQQIVWLYYGLGLKHKQIGKILKDNFQLNDNPGSVSLRLRHGRIHLFQRIHIARQNPPPALTHKDIDATMGELLGRHFESKISHCVLTFAAELNIPAHSQLTVSQQAKLLDLLAHWFRQKIALHIPDDLIETAILQLLDGFFANP